MTDQIVDIWRTDRLEAAVEAFGTDQADYGLVPGAEVVQDVTAGDYLVRDGTAYRVRAAIHDGADWRVLLVPHQASGPETDHMELAWVRRVVDDNLNLPETTTAVDVRGSHGRADGVNERGDER